MCSWIWLIVNTDQSRSGLVCQRGSRTQCSVSLSSRERNESQAKRRSTEPQPWVSNGLIKENGRTVKSPLHSGLLLQNAASSNLKIPHDLRNAVPLVQEMPHKGCCGPSRAPLPAHPWPASSEAPDPPSRTGTPLSMRQHFAELPGRVRVRNDRERE